METLVSDTLGILPFIRAAIHRPLHRREKIWFYIDGCVCVAQLDPACIAAAACRSRSSRGTRESQSAYTKARGGRASDAQSAAASIGQDPADGTQLQVKKWAAQNEAEQVGGTRFRMRELWAVVRCASWPTISQIWPWCGAPRCFNSKLRPEYRTGLQS